MLIRGFGTSGWKCLTHLEEEECRGVTSVLLVTSQPIFQAGLTAALEVHHCVDVVGAVEDGPAALERMRTMVPIPDVVVLEVDTCDDEVLEWVRVFSGCACRRLSS